MRKVNLKNYSTTMTTSKSMMAIEQTLCDIGVANIAKNFDQEKGVVSAIYFEVSTNGKPMAFRLPARIDAVYKVFYDSYERKYAVNEEKLWQQAERTAWKIVSDWVAAQAAMIKLEQAEVMEVFLPYAYIKKSNATLFEMIKGENYKLLTG
jgi:hypothetical protein